MSLWTISDTGTSWSFKTSHLANLRRTWQSLAVGTCTFSSEDIEWDADPLWARYTPLTIAKDGVTWFHGKLLKVTHIGEPGREAHEYQLVDAWWDVNDVTFLQQRLVFDDEGNSSYIDSSEYLYGQDPYGNKLNSGEVITEALNYVLSDRAAAGLPTPFTLGEIETDVDFPWRYEHDKKCLQVINEVLGWSPDVCGYLDHSTTPPTLHIKKIASLVPVTITIPNATQRHACTLTRRDDVASNAVIIQYKRSSSEGIVNVEVEKYPAGESLYGYQRVFQSIDLDPGGSGSVSGTTIEMVTSLIYTSQQWWWEKKCPQINTTYNKFIEVSELGVPDPADTTSYYDYKDAPPLTWKNELIGGSVPPSSNFTAKKQVFRAKCRLKVYSSKSHTDDTLLFNGFIHIATNELSVVNGGSGTGSNYYTAGNVSSGDLAEPTPVGLPRAYYEATHTPQWEGQITITEREVSSDFAGNVINISGGRGEWESMNAVPQSVDLDADNGVTSLSVGLANHLRIEDMVELQKQSRNRTTFYSYERVTGGSSGSQASITAPPLNNMGGYTPFNLNQRTIELES